MKINSDHRGILKTFALCTIIPIFIGAVISFKASGERVSGIVYNTKNDHALTGNTTFSIRASESTYVSQENRGSYCLPPHSRYIALVNRAAENKNIKVIVTAKKYFAIQAPWTCRANVTVVEAN